VLVDEEVEVDIDVKALDEDVEELVLVEVLPPKD